MSKSVFIFDDDVDILELCRILLTQKGYQVFTSNNCSDVVKRVLEARPGVVLMDNKIPDVGGIVAVQTLKADPATTDIPVIFFSANTNVKQLSEEAGADAFLQKPFDIAGLEKIVAETLAGNS